ncbi:MAG: ABC transporter ATP-binding protein [Bacillota bacterium]
MSHVLVSRLDFGYGAARGGRAVLRGLDLSVPAGTLTAVVGPNGSGKSTLLKVISAYLKPASGSVSINGRDPHSMGHAERAALVTYCGDEPEPAFDFTVWETVIMGRVSRGDGVNDALAAETAMQRMGVAHLKDRAITSLSSGEKQRVYLARAICQDPEVFLLDEPTAHLDMAYELSVMEMARDMAEAQGKTVLTVLHDLNLALRFASRLYFMKDGRVAYSLEPREVDEDVVRDVYGVTASLIRHPSLGCPVALPTSRV